MVSAAHQTTRDRRRGLASAARDRKGHEESIAVVIIGLGEEAGAEDLCEDEGDQTCQEKAMLEASFCFFRFVAGSSGP